LWFVVYGCLWFVVYGCLWLIVYNFGDKENGDKDGDDGNACMHQLIEPWACTQQI
jgi:hypothetical protein